MDEPGDDDPMLQMDIEGAEYRTLFTTSLSTLRRFRVMVIEFHHLDPEIFSSTVKSQLMRFVAILWVKVGKQILVNLNHIFKKGGIDHMIFNFSRLAEPYLIGPLLRKIRKTHTCVHVHPNNNSTYSFIGLQTGMNIPEVIEITLLRNNQFGFGHKVLIPPSIPHPLDIQNSSNNPEATLNKHWRM